MFQIAYFELSCDFGGSTHEHACVKMNKYEHVKMDSLVEARLDLFVSNYRIKEARRGHAYFINLINGIRYVKVLHLSKDVLELIYFSCQELPMFNNLVSLSIESDRRRGWQTLPLLIKNSPNLETLIFKGLIHCKAKNCGDACPCNDSEETMTSSCLSSCRVKLLEISGYRGTTRELKKVKHFLDKLPCLELVKIVAANKLQVASTYKEKLLTLPRASSNCEIQVII